jgi:hypothetical protein
VNTLLMLPGLFVMLAASAIVENVGRAFWPAPEGHIYRSLMNHGPEFMKLALSGTLPLSAGLLVISTWIASGFTAGQLGSQFADDLDGWFTGMIPPSLFALVMAFAGVGRPTLLGLTGVVLTIAAAWAGTRFGKGRKGAGPH